MATSKSSSYNKRIKLQYRYGGKIMCGSGGKLRYVGGTNGIMAVDRDISYTELIIKLRDTWGPSMRLRCKLPGDDLDLLVLIESDEDLRHVIEEYDRYAKDSKIRVILDDSPPPIIENRKSKEIKVEVDSFVGLKATLQFGYRVFEFVGL